LVLVNFQDEQLPQITYKRQYIITSVLSLDYRGASDWSSNYTHVVLTAIFLRQQVAPRKSIENLMSRFGATFFFLQKLCAPNFADCAKSIKLFYDGLCP